MILAILATIRQLLHRPAAQSSSEVKLMEKMIHQKKIRGYRSCKIVKSRQRYSNGHLPYHCSFHCLAYAWRGVWTCLSSTGIFASVYNMNKSARPGTEILKVWHSVILGGSDRSPKIIVTLLELRTISVISVSDLVIADHARIGCHKTQNARDKGSLIFYSYSKRMWGLPVHGVDTAIILFA